MTSRLTIRRCHIESLAAVMALGLALLSSACGGGGGGGATPAQPNPVPILTSISPSSATSGGAAFTLTVNGSSFISSSKVQWDGSARPTTFVSSTKLTATISASDLNVSTPASAAVVVVNPAPGGGVSENFIIFDILPGVPAVTSLFPSVIPAGSPGFTLTVNGSGFDARDSKVLWNGSPRSSIVRSSVVIEAQIPASDVAAVGTSQVSVQTAPPGGGTSSALTFHIGQPPSSRNDTRATATPLFNGTIAASISPYGDEDFYSFHATAGNIVTVEIFARRLTDPSQLDSAIEIVDSSGTRPTTGCRSPDHPFDVVNFVVNDPTPNEFDDECVDDDIELGVVQDSRLEFQPNASGTYYVHVVDLRGDGRPDLNYELSLSGAD